jgi:trimethylamine--corrinoid protein Co-methyltransferase
MQDVIEPERGRRPHRRRASAFKPTDGFLPTHPIHRTTAPVEILSDEGLSLIESYAERILQEIGIEFRGDLEALAMWQQAGADIEGERVRFPVGLCRRLCETAPSSFVQHARNPNRSVTIGGDWTVLAPIYGCPFVHDLERGKRYGTIDDFQNLVKLTYLSPSLHHSGGTVCEPTDVNVNKRHLDMIYAHLRFSDKPFMGSVTRDSRAQDSVEMCRIVFGRDFVEANCVLLSLVNANSPLVWDQTMLNVAKVYARANQGTIMSPFILIGAMSPISIAGTLAQMLAETLAGIAFTQLCRPGAPVVFGSFVSSLSMQSGAPAFGMPESSLALYASAQLARRLKVPFRSGGALTTSKVLDAQAGYESAQSLIPSLAAGVNFVLHAAGGIEGGLTTSYEKLVLDADQCAQLQRFSEGIDLSEEAFAFETIRKVGPGSHFLGAAHTLKHCKTGLFRSKMSDTNSREQWEAEGRLESVARANAVWRRMLEEYEVPALSEDRDEELNHFMAARKAVLPNEVG